MTAIAIIHRDKILEKIAQGEMLDKVASDLGIKAPNISLHLASDPEYKQAREIGAELRLHKALTSVHELSELGTDETGRIVGITQEVSNLARVRDSALKAAQWFAEREFPHRWGAKQAEITINTGVSIDAALGQSALSLLDKLRTVATQGKDDPGG